jgi:SOS-response transcriptional repressor LexA
LKKIFAAFGIMASMAEMLGHWLRKTRGPMSRELLAARSGVCAATIKRIEEGGNTPNHNTLLGLGRALGVDGDALIDWARGRIAFHQFVKASAAPRGPVPAQPGGGTPILGEISAGGMVEQFHHDAATAPDLVPVTYPGRTYALRVSGDSMSPEYRAGEIIILADVSPGLLADGEDAVVQCDSMAGNGSTFKRVVRLNGGRIRLMPLNRAYEPIECSIDRIVRAGRVLGVYRPVFEARP